MTRINLEHPHNLSDQHLIAEYRELPRVFAQAAAWVARGKPGRIPTDYRLGPGHVRFFYPRTRFLAQRQRALIAECVARGFRVQHTTTPQPVRGASAGWSPSRRALAISRERLAQKLSQKPGWYRRRGVAL